MSRILSVPRRRAVVQVSTHFSSVNRRRATTDHAVFAMWGAGAVVPNAPVGSLAVNFQLNYQVVHRCLILYEIMVMARPATLAPLPTRNTFPANRWVWLEGCEQQWFYPVAVNGDVITMRHCYNAWTGSWRGECQLDWNVRDECRVLMPEGQACFLAPCGRVLGLYNKERTVHYLYQRCGPGTVR